LTEAFFKERRTGRLIANLNTWGSSNWAVITPDGRFDTADLERPLPLHWTTEDDPLRPLPIENFMRDYYTPQLLFKVLSKSPLEPIRPIASLKRALPQLRLNVVRAGQQNSPKADILIDVQEGVYTSPNGTRREKSGAMNLKVFRDGRLVRVVDGDLLRVQPLRVSVEIPDHESDRQVEVSAYAFNSDGVKSATVMTSIDIKGTGRKRIPKAHILSVDINETAKSRGLRLSFAASDADRMGELLATHLSRSGTWAAPIVPRVVVATRNSPKAGSKAAIRAALWELQSRVGSNDLVIVSFSGHGFTDASGGFYLVPSDVDPSTQGRLQSSSISTDALTAWLRPIDAGEIVLIVDACQSAAAVDSMGFKPGPMGSAGLGQLAYDKKMRVLAASQSSGVALENDSRKHGLLTYALLVDGLINGGADWRPRDGRITIGEWLQFAIMRVPTLVDKKENNPTRALLVPERSTVSQLPALFDFKRGTSDFTLQVREQR
jgi:hypothetical protein